MANPQKKPGPKNLPSFLQGMTPQQMAKIGALLLIVIVILYQAIGLFSDGAPAPAPHSENKQAMSSAPPGEHPAGAVPGNGQVPVTNQAPQLRQTDISNDKKFQERQGEAQEKYIQTLNELEELKVQRQIAETQQGISAAKLATVTAEHDIDNLLTKPAPAEVPATAYSNTLANPTRQGEGVVPTGTVPGVAPPNGMVPPPPAPIEYTLISVSMQISKWSAVVGYQGKLFSVSIGDVLPPDGSQVISINKSSITLKKDDQIRKINIVSSI